MTVTDDDGDDENDEDDNGEGCAEVIATSENQAQIETPGETAKESRHRVMKATQTEPTAASSKQIPEKEVQSSLCSLGSCHNAHTSPALPLHLHSRGPSPFLCRPLSQSRLSSISSPAISQHPRCRRTASS